MDQPQTNTSSLTPFEWDAIIQGIKDQQCIICTGPGIFTLDANEAPQVEQLKAFLKEHQNALRIRVQENGWFHLQPRGSDGPAYSAVRRFYSQVKPNSKDVLQLLAQLKVHLLLSLTPDRHLKEAFENQHLPHRFDFYLRNQPDRNTQVPTAELPMVYNIIGDIKVRNSLVLTYDDFYDYLESVFKGNSMSNMLKNNILDAQYFLFLGIPFDQWFVHLFMRILRQHKEREKGNRYATGRTLSQEDIDSTSEQYNIKFIDSNISEFVATLHEKCKAEDLVKTPDTSGSKTDDTAFFRDLQRAVAENEFEQISDRLKEVLRGVGQVGKPFLIKLIQLTGRHNELKEHISLGIINYEEQKVETNKLRKAFFDLIDSLQQGWKDLNIQL